MLVILLTTFSLIGFISGQVCVSPPKNPISIDTHYVVLLDASVGYIPNLAHTHFFEQLYCSLVEYNDAAVPFDVWHIDQRDESCEIFNNSNVRENIYAYKESHKVPTETTICQKLKAAKNCAKNAEFLSSKVEIAVPMVLLDSVGDCDLDSIFSFSYKLTIFRLSNYFNDGGIFKDTKHAEFVFMGSSEELFPRSGWKPVPEMIPVLKRVNTNVARALSWKFEQMLTMDMDNTQDIKLPVESSNFLNEVKAGPTTMSTTSFTAASSISPDIIKTSTTMPTEISIAAERELPLVLFPVNGKLTHDPHRAATTTKAVVTINATKSRKVLTSTTGADIAIDASTLLDVVKTKTTTAPQSFEPTKTSTKSFVTTEEQYRGGRGFDYFEALPMHDSKYNDGPVLFGKEGGRRGNGSAQGSLRETTTSANLNVAFASVGRFFGDSEHGFFWFILLLVFGLLFVVVSIVVCYFCFCHKKRAKYHVLKKEADSGIVRAYQKVDEDVERSGNVMAIADNNDGVIETNTPYLTSPNSTPALTVDYPMTTPSAPGRRVYSPLAITPVSSQRSQALPELQFRTTRDDTQTVRSLKAHSDEELSYLPTDR